jgi:hypothetical protein
VGGVNELEDEIINNLDLSVGIYLIYLLEVLD